MNRSEGNEFEKITEELRRIFIQRRALYEREEQLLNRLNELRSEGNTAAIREASVEGDKSNEVISVPNEVRIIELVEPVRRDRYGKDLKVGDRVEFLTPGKLIGKIWKVYGFTEKHVLCERHKGLFKTNRELHNVRRLN